jgi:hypothetical protein
VREQPAASILVVACIAIGCKSDGEPIGTLSIVPREPNQERPVVLFQGSPGDRINFVSDVAVDQRTHPNMTLNGLKGMLEEATLTVTLTMPSGDTRPTTCSLYSGTSREARGGLDSASLAGARNGCEFLLERPGSYSVQATVAWPRGAPRKANLEIVRAKRK